MTRMGDKTHVYGVLVWRPEENLGRFRRKWEDKIEMAV